MNVTQSGQLILEKPFVNYLGGNTSLYESNKMVGGKRSTKKYNKSRRYKKLRKTRRTRNTRSNRPR